MKTLTDIDNIKNKKILLRTDFDVPVEKLLITNYPDFIEDPRLQGNRDELRIGESFRIKKQKEAIDYLLSGGAKVMMIAHISSIDSFESILSQLEEIIGHKITFIKTPEDINNQLSVAGNDLFLLDNVRRNKGEEENNKDFAKQLAEGFDFYINNAFAVCHRKHASVSAITEFLPSYAGLIIEEEVNNLKKAVDHSPKGKVIIMGGAKASTKVPVIKNFLDKSEQILIGGVIANDILKIRGVDIDGSKSDENLTDLFAGLDLDNKQIIMPQDYNIHEGRYLDIGPESVKNYAKIISGAGLIIWNGPMGYFEDDRFGLATKAIGEAVADSSAFKVIGGGDTVAAINKFKLDPKKFDLISTGGGAMLEFLAGNRLPGLEALGYY